VLRKVGEVYKRDGVEGLLRRGIAKPLERMVLFFRGGARALVHVADRIAGETASIGLLSCERALLARNSVFRNRHKGQRCFVIGNGPSLKTQDLSLLAREITFVMSGFWKHPIVKQWQPTYYVLADSVFFDGSQPMQKFFADLHSSIHSTTFFMPLNAREVIQRVSLLPLEQTYFVAFHGSPEIGWWGRPDFARHVPGVISVSQLAIMAAMYMGCSPIYLLGLDHDWLAHRGMDMHFYEGKTVENHPRAHGDLGQISYKLDMEAQLRLWYAYEAMQKVANAEGIRIVNATNGGFLDVFERADYGSLFPAASV